jgi:hypothetical protein
MSSEVGFGVAEIGDEERVELSGEVSHEAASDLFVALAGLGAPCDVGAGFGVVDHAVVGDRPERVVALAITAAVEAVARGLAA